MENLIYIPSIYKLLWVAAAAAAGMSLANVEVLSERACALRVFVLHALVSAVARWHNWRLPSGCCPRVVPTGNILSITTQRKECPSPEHVDPSRDGSTKEQRTTLEPCVRPSDRAWDSHNSLRRLSYFC